MDRAIGFDGDFVIPPHRVIAAWGDDTARMQSLVADVERGVLDIRLLESLTPEQASEAHRAMHAGGIRGRNVLTFGA